MKKYEMKCLEGDEPRILVTKEFIEKNKLKIDINMARKIVENDEGIFGFGSDIASDLLPFDEVKHLFKKEYRKDIVSGKIKYKQITDIYEITQDFLDYMVFAWMKAKNERALSAGRSISKLSTWMKILGREDVANVLEDKKLYPMYGKPALRKACVMLGIKCPYYIC